MERHERSCSLNPDRQCWTCEKAGLNGKELPELIAFAKAKADESGALSINLVAEIEDLADGCPDCVLAAARQSNVYFVNWEYRTESAAFWREHDRYDAEEFRAMVGAVP